ncbi:hypothetical protein B0H12DRAFT_39763 [Mycena haematopus]|nr:hypothetical protein B0H12DRAFT_39763 [Mycena haematopus]
MHKCPELRKLPKAPHISSVNVRFILIPPLALPSHSSLSFGDKPRARLTAFGKRQHPRTALTEAIRSTLFQENKRHSYGLPLAMASLWVLYLSASS